LGTKYQRLKIIIIQHLYSTMTSLEDTEALDNASGEFMEGDEESGQGSESEIERLVQGCHKSVTHNCSEVATSYDAM